MSPLWQPPTFPSDYERSTRGGTNIVASGVDTKGTWTSLIASTARDAYGIWTLATGMHVTATVTAGLLDIGVGPTDPTVDVVIPDWNVAACPTAGSQASIMPKMQFWPVFIPAGTKIWARLASLVSADTCVVTVVLQEDSPWGGYVCDGVTAYGVTVSGSKGINLTSGVAAYGAQAQLVASTTSDHKLWAIGMGQAADTTTLANTEMYAQLLIGSGATGPIGEWGFNTWTSEAIGGPWPPFPVYKPVPSGTRIDGRILAGANTDVFDLIAYGM